MKEANKGKEPPQFMSTHPSSESRIRNIQTWLNEIIIKYPPIAKNMVSRDGLEPSTHSLKGNCSTN